jgi:hypothetical protein
MVKKIIKYCAYCDVYIGEVGESKKDDVMFCSNCIQKMLGGEE